MQLRHLLVLSWFFAACGPNVSSSGEGSSGELGSSGGASTGGSSSTTVADSGTSSSSGEPFTCETPSSCESCESWRDAFDGPSGDQDWFSSLLIAPNGDVVALGTQNSSFFEASGSEARIVRYTADGTMSWERILDDMTLQAVSGAFDEDGSIDIVLERPQGVSASDAWFARLSGNGQVLLDVEPLSEGSPRQLIRTDGGDLLLLSRLRADVEDVVQLSRVVDGTAELVGPAELQDFAAGTTSLALGPAGSVFVAGETDDGAPRLLRLVPDGAEWAVEGAIDAFEGFEGEGRVVDVTTLADGSAIYALAARMGPTRVGRLNPRGLPVWAVEVEGVPCCDVAPTHVTSDEEGRVFLLAGASNAAERVVAISPCDGATLWTWEEEESEARGYGSAIVSGGGGLFVAGFRGVNGTDLTAWIVGFEL